MRRAILVTLLLAATGIAGAQNTTDHRCLDFGGIPLEGHPDTLDVRLRAVGFSPWGLSDDGESRYYRGQFYGIRAKLTVNLDEQTHLVSSALISCGPYRTRAMFERNFTYFLGQLQKHYGGFTPRNGAYYYLGDYGMVKVSEDESDMGTSDIHVFYYTTAPYYKDASLMGLKGNVQQVVTRNPVAESAMEQFDRYGRTSQTDLTDRHYDSYGYLTSARMHEQDGAVSELTYEYDSHQRLIKRKLTNTEAGITYTNTYTYASPDDDLIASQSQKVFDADGDCIVSISMENHYEEYDETGNWTRNQLALVYWEKGQEAQPTTVTQTRTISYWE